MTLWREGDTPNSTGSGEASSPTSSADAAAIAAWSGIEPASIDPHAQWPAMPLQPRDFVEFIGTALGTEDAQLLANYVLGLVSEDGEVDFWIQEIGRGRTRGSLSAAVAHFLIFRLAEGAAQMLSNTHPVLSRVDSAMTAIEREYGLEDGDDFPPNEAPLEWQALNRQWNAAMHQLVTDILLRNGERAVAEAHAARDEREYEIGRALFRGAT